MVSSSTHSKLNFKLTKMYRMVSVSLVCLLLICVQFCGALLQIPKNVRLDSRITVVRSGNTEELMVEEFIDKEERDVHIKVLDVKNTLTSYYRIGDEIDSSGFFASSLVKYDHSEGICREERTTSWRLKELSDYLSLLYSSPQLETRTIQEDRTSLGALALLEVFYENSHLFILETRGFDEIKMSEMLYFEANIPISDNYIVRLICSIPAMNTLTKRDNLIPKETILSQVITNVYPRALAMIKLGKGDMRLELNARTLLNSYSNDYDAVSISLQSVQERSMSKHLGLAPGSYDEQNPFTMPPGAGCGAIANRNSLYISARQFSGIFEAKDFGTESYVAYDSRTGQLRIDSIGEYKLIYNLNTGRIILISDQATQPDQSSSASAIGDYRAHCAQTFVNHTDFELDTTGVNSMEDLLGVGKYVALMFLGTKLLEDKTRCLVFEREISSRKIPLLVKFNLRLKPRPTDRFFLVYHFVNQLAGNETSEFGPNSYKSMWLKRLELLSSSSVISKYTILNSQLTFDEFTWTLESVAEDTRDRESKLLHPVRTFDTAECSSTDERFQLEFVVKESPDSDWSVRNYKRDFEQSSFSLDDEFLSQLNVIEEEIMVYTAKRLGVARSKISEFELVVPRLAANEKRFLLIRAILVESPHFTTGLNLIGWIANVRSIEFSKHRKWIKTQISRYECSLIMATTAEITVPHMFYCPNYGCGELDSLNSSFEYTPKTEKQRLPPFEETFEMCEVYELKKSVDFLYSQQLVETSVQQSLGRAEVSFDLLSQQSTEPLVFRGEIVKVSFTKGLSLSLGKQIMAGRCFTNQTSLLNLSSKISNLDVDTVELRFEQHHSEVYCYKACHLYPSCQTYSYSTTSNICTLTNIPKSYIFGPTDVLTKALGPVELANLREEPGCRMYMLGAMSLYTLNPIVRKISLDAMSQSRVEYFYTLASLEECANLCLDNKIRCTGFWYFRMISVCVLEDQDSYLFQTKYASNPVQDDDLSSTERDKKIKRFMNLITENEWHLHHECHAYDRDYEPYFIEERSTKIELQEPDGQDNPSNGYPTGQEDLIRARAGGRVLYHLTSSDCLRECAIFDPACVMVDYCTVTINSVPTRRCSLYHIRSPLLIDGTASSGLKLSPYIEQELASVEPALTDLELLYFMDGVSDKHNATVVRNGGCFHHYMTGDYLLLKRQILDRKLGEEQAKLLGAIVARDLRESQNYLNTIKKFVQNQNSAFVPGGLGLFSALLLLFGGISAGLMASACGQVENPMSAAATTGMLSLSGVRDTLANRATSVLSRLAGTRSSNDDLSTRVELANIVRSD